MSGAWGREAFDRVLEWTLREERALAPCLPASGRDAFARYYATLPGPDDGAARARYRRGMWRSEAGWVARWIERRRRDTGRRPRVLDAGSGFGTHAMLFAAAGADVLGVDLRPDRVEVAEARRAACAERLGLELPLRHARADLTAAWDGDHDLVWVYNALSHIEPLAPFLDQARRHLLPGGVLAIGDINGAHAGHVRRLAAQRGQVEQRYVAPDGASSGYAVERTFPPAGLRAEIRGHGFRIVRHELFWGGLGVLPAPLYEGVLRPLQARWWLGVPFARRQLLVAAPGGQGRGPA